MTELDPKTVVIRYVDAVAEGDLAAIVESFAEDATWSYPGDLPLTRVWTGRDAIVNDFLGGAAGLFAPGGAPKVTLTNVLADGAQVVAEWLSEGTAAGGGHYYNRCLGVFTVEGGKIAGVREYADTQHVERVLFPRN